MTGIVRVVSSKATVPTRHRTAARSPAGRDHAGHREGAREDAGARQNTVDIGAQGKGNVSFFAFIPST